MDRYKNCPSPIASSPWECASVIVNNYNYKDMYLYIYNESSINLL